MLYFAYGSNMNTEQMEYRCPGAEALGPAMLPGYRLVERAVADIDADPDAEVWGVLWQIDGFHLRALDRYEGYPRFYTRHLATVTFIRPVTGAKTAAEALVYEMTPECKGDRENGGYSEPYRLGCSLGAAENGLPVNGYTREGEQYTPPAWWKDLAQCTTE